MARLEAKWSCSKCTFYNYLPAIRCQICGAPKIQQQTHTVDSDYAFAKRLQAQFNATDRESTPDSNHNSHQNSSTNSSLSTPFFNALKIVSPANKPRRYPYTVTKIIYASVHLIYTAKCKPYRMSIKIMLIHQFCHQTEIH